MQRRRKRKSKRNDLAGLKEIETEGVDFFPFLAGMVSSLAIIFLIWDQFATPQATGPVGSRSPAKTLTIDPHDFDAVVESGDIKLLGDLLLELDQQDSGKPPAELMEISRQCAELADQMLTMDLGPAQEKFAKTSKIAALTKIYGLDYLHELNTPSIAQELHELATSYLDDPDADLVRNANLAIFKVNTLEQKKSKSTLVEPIADDIVELLEQYPDDGAVISTIRLVLNAYLNEEPVVGRSLVEEFCDRENVLESPKAKAICLDFSDRVLLMDAGYEQLFADRWVKGTVGQRELLIKSIELIKNRGFGGLLTRKVDEVAHWFEKEDRYESAIQIYDAMLESAENAANAQAVSLARKLAISGLKRNKLIHQKVDLSGFAPDGSPIQSNEFYQRAVAVVFWSNLNSTSKEALGQFHLDTQEWEGKPITVLAVCVDKNSVDEVKQVAAKFQRFRFMVGNPAGDGIIPVLEQCPSDRVPRAMLIGREGTVVDVNVPMGELKTAAEGL